MRTAMFVAAGLCALACDPAAAQTLTGRQTNNGFLGGSDSRDGEGRFYDEYSVAMSAGQRVRISATRQTDSSLDPVLEIYGPDNQLVASDDDGAGYPNARTEFNAPRTGTYRVRVRAFMSTTGPYDLVVEPLNSYAALEAVNEGRFNDSVPRFGANGSHYRDYRVSLAQGEGIALRMLSATIDSYLYLYEAGRESETALATNDDSGGTLNSALLFIAPRAGTYTVRASELSHADGGWVLLATRLPRVEPPR